MGEVQIVKMNPVLSLRSEASRQHRKAEELRRQAAHLEKQAVGLRREAAVCDDEETEYSMAAVELAKALDR